MAQGMLLYLEQVNIHEYPPSVGDCWAKWLKRFDNLIIALDITEMSLPASAKMQDLVVLQSFALKIGQNAATAS